MLAHTHLYTQLKLSIQCPLSTLWCGKNIILNQATTAMLCCLSSYTTRVILLTCYGPLYKVWTVKYDRSAVAKRSFLNRIISSNVSCKHITILSRIFLFMVYHYHRISDHDSHSLIGKKWFGFPLGEFFTSNSIETESKLNRRIM